MPKVFYAQRLPQATIDEIKRMAHINGVSEAMIIERLVAPPKPIKPVTIREERAPYLKPSGRIS